MRGLRLGWMLGAALLAGSSGAAQSTSPSESPARPRIAGDVLAGRLLTKVPPSYPAEARAAHIQGVVMLHAVIGADGVVKKLEVLSGPPELRQAASDAVGQWTYKPYLLNGVPTEVEATVSVRFTLADATADPHPARTVAEEKAPVPADAVKVSGGVMAGLLVTKVNATYSPDAKAKGISGAVVMGVVVGKDGTVLRVNVMSGPEDLRDNAVEAVRQWVYRPYLLNGQPVNVETTVTVNFTLGG